MSAEDEGPQRGFFPAPRPEHAETGAEGQRQDRESGVKSRAYAGIIVVVVFFLILLAIAIRNVIAVVFLGVIVGVTLTPIADRLQRYHVPRVLSGLIVYATVIGAVAAFAWYAEQTVVNESEQFKNVRGQYDQIANEYNLPNSTEIEDYIKNHASTITGGIASTVVTAFGVGVYFVAIFIIALLFSMARDRIRDNALIFFPPQQRKRGAELLDMLGSQLRRTVLGLFIGMVIVGTLVYVGLRLIGFPFPLLLAVFAFLTELVPIIGPWAGYVPALLVGVTQGVGAVIKVSILYLAVQQFENHIMVPWLHSWVNEVPALLIVIAVLIGAAVMGILGALIAVPTAVLAHTLYFEVLLPWRRSTYEYPEDRPIRSRRLPR